MVLPVVSPAAAFKRPVASLNTASECLSISSRYAVETRNHDIVVHMVVLATVSHEVTWSVELPVKLDGSLQCDPPIRSDSDPWDVSPVIRPFRDRVPTLHWTGATLWVSCFPEDQYTPILPAICVWCIIPSLISLVL